MRKTNAYGLVSCLLGLTYIFGTQTTTVMALTETVTRVEEDLENTDTSPDTLSTDEVNSEERLEENLQPTTVESSEVAFRSAPTDTVTITIPNLVVPSNNLNPVAREYVLWNPEVQPLFFVRSSADKNSPYFEDELEEFGSYFIKNFDKNTMDINLEKSRPDFSTANRVFSSSLNTPYLEPLSEEGIVNIFVINKQSQSEVKVPVKVKYATLSALTDTNTLPLLELSTDIFKSHSTLEIDVDRHIYNYCEAMLG